MTYELAKQLKEAGFPQRMSAGISDYPGYCGYGVGILYEGEIPGIHDVYAPNLEELIEACGKEFGRLTTHDFALSWMAYDFADNEAGHGSTPTEALARLWLALNKQ